jgi:hypothetical protein
MSPVVATWMAYNTSYSSFLHEQFMSPWVVLTLGGMKMKEKEISSSSILFPLLRQKMENELYLVSAAGVSLKIGKDTMSS